LGRGYENLINKEKEVVLRGENEVARLELVWRLGNSWKKYFLVIVFLEYNVHYCSWSCGDRGLPLHYFILNENKL
jgi:hypothetical protein